jgi:hypothetical protein
MEQQSPSVRVIFEGAERIQKLNLAAGDLMTEGNNREPVPGTLFILLLDNIPESGCRAKRHRFVTP